ncbi:hypothetical protein AB0K89_18945 [Streptomyces cinnamoneus]|uniref:hypothetical protein n=1 Tax=Streptomyces cinnamoneus TaxID=53446 RepID=UPI0034359069
MDRRRRQTFEAAAPMLAADERVDLITCANVGTVSVRRQVATAALAGVLSGGTMMASVRPRQMYLVLTDRRLLFFDASTATGKPGRLLIELARPYVAAGPARKGMLGLTLITELALAGRDEGLRLAFPSPCRKDGRQLLGLLPAAS